MNDKPLEIDAETVKAAIENNDNVVILDVRSDEEVARGTLPNSIHIELADIEAKIAKAVPDKDKTIYAYCLTGGRSGQATQLLRNMGYTNAYSISQGILAWRAKHYPTV